MFEKCGNGFLTAEVAPGLLIATAITRCALPSAHSTSATHHLKKRRQSIVHDNSCQSNIKPVDRASLDKTRACVRYTPLHKVTPLHVLGRNASHKAALLTAPNAQASKEGLPKKVCTSRLRRRFATIVSRVLNFVGFEVLSYHALVLN